MQNKFAIVYCPVTYLVWTDYNKADNYIIPGQYKDNKVNNEFTLEDNKSGIRISAHVRTRTNGRFET